MKDLIIDSNVYKIVGDRGVTGYFVRAYDPNSNSFKSVDIVCLTKESLKRWLSKYEKEALVDMICYMLKHFKFIK